MIVFEADYYKITANVSDKDFKNYQNTPSCCIV